MKPLNLPWLRKDWDPTIAIDCSYPEEHGAEHEPHPESGKMVCNICHTPPRKRAKETSEATEQ